MKESEYTLKIHESWMTKLIVKCQQNLSALNQIKSFMDSDIKLDGSKVMAKTVMINSYARCGGIDYAQKIFDSIPDSGKDSMNVCAMIKAYITNYHYDDALALYEKYDAFNDHVSHLYAIDACTQSCNVAKGKKIHSKLNLNECKDMSVCIKLKSALIEFYGRIGDIQSALRLYESTNDEHKNIVMVSTMMGALLNNDLNDDALNLYHQIDKIAIEKDKICYILAIKACINTHNFEIGKRIHSECQNMNDVLLKTALIDLYSHFGDVPNALRIFESIHDHQRRTASFNAMMRGHINNKSYQEAVHVYDNIESVSIRRKKEDISHILASIAYANLNQMEEATQCFYNAKCFGNTRYFDLDKCIYILSLFKLYNTKTFDVPRSFMNSVIAKCGTNLSMIRKVHKLIDELPIGRDEDVMIIKTALINAYGECGQTSEALSVFDSIPNDIKDTVCIGAMMKVFGNNGHHRAVLELYDKFDEMNDDISHLLALGSCAELEDLNKGKEIHQKINETNKEYKTMQLRNGLLHFYGKCGDAVNALKIFKEIPMGQHDVVTMGSMLNALCKSNCNNECIRLFKEMKPKYKIEPNMICYAIVLTACINGTNFHFGEQIHQQLKNEKYLNWMLNDAEIQAPLISMYGKCGKLHIAQQIFDDIRNKEPVKYKSNIAVWNAMIHSFGRNGQIAQAKNLYNTIKHKMSGLKGDSQTFILLINACAHSGDLNTARKIWYDEINDDSIKYDGQCITTFIDCLSRKGHLDEAHKLIKEYESHSSSPYIAMWHSLLFGCKKFGNVQLAETLYDGMLSRFEQSDERMSSAKTCMYNIYIAAAEYEKANKMS